jgi:hypothetical protein
MTYVVPPDAEMVQRADGILIAAAVSSHAEFDVRGAIVTVNSLRIERVVKGDLAACDLVRVVEIGGRVGSLLKVVPGVPQYEPGQRYLVFLEATEAGEWRTWSFGLGQFRFVADRQGRELLLRGSGAISGFDSVSLDRHVNRARDGAAFLSFVEATVRGRHARIPYLVSSDVEPDAAVSPAGFTRGSYLLIASGSSTFRWSSPSATFVTKGTQASLDGPAAVDTGFAAWNGDSSSDIGYSRGGVDPSANGITEAPDGKNAVVFSDPALGSFTGGAGGFQAVGGAYSLGGESFVPPTEVDISISASFAPVQQDCLNTVVAHEAGHTLGFRHSNEGQSLPNGGPCPGGFDCDSSALMTGGVTQCAFNGQLQSWDARAASVVYGSGPPPCTPPNISSVNANPTTITSGQSSTLTVVATGTSALSFQWYIGSAPDTSNPVPGGTSSSVNVSPTSTTSYWVRVTGQCAPVADSSPVTVTVTGGVCPDVVVGSISVSQNGATYNLSVSPTGGTSFTYAWFQGDTPGVGGSPAGNTQIINVPVPASPTNYWVRVTNQCESSALSSTVEVAPCPAVVAPTPTVTSVSTGFQLVANPSGGVINAITWFQGSQSTGTQIGTGPTITVNPSASTTYSYRATNTCGSLADSPTVTVTPGSPCPPPVIGPILDKKVTVNTSTTLSAAASGGQQPYTFQWFRGTPPDTSSPVGSGATVNTGVLTATTQFWVRVTSVCGASADSPAVRVETGPPARRRAVRR